MAQRMNGRHGWITAWAISLCAGTTVGLAQADRSAPGVNVGLQDIAAAMAEAAANLNQPIDPEADLSAEGAAGEAGSDELPPLEGEVRVDENMIVELHVQDEDLANVLQLLSLQSQRNIVANKDVSATVTANLYGVTFYEALDAILHINGYGWVEKGNFIYVYTAEQLETMVDQRQRVAKTIRLNYLTAVDAAEFVTPMLSDGGFIKTNGKTTDFSIGSDGPIGADDYANGAVMVVFDFEENIQAIEELIAELDSRPTQVLVEATILQTSLNEANAFGVDFSLVADLDIESFVNAGGPLGAVDSLLTGEGSRIGDGGAAQAGIPGDNEGRAITSTAGNTSGPGTLKLGIVDEDVAVFVRMLDEVADTTIISNPKILSLNRQPSRVLVGRKVGYLSTTSTETSTTQTVEFLDTGTQLYFRPFVSNNGLIRMELKPQVSEAIIRNATDASGAVVTIPDEITNEIVTNVIVPDGNTIVLGGLFREATDASRRQVPVLGDIPLIGAAFRGHEDQTERSEIIFMIKPSIVNDQVLLEQGERGMDDTRRARAGARAGLLPWSREKQSSQLLVEADRLAAEGNIDGALYCVRRALAHNPYQIDAIAMRERLLNQDATWPTRSSLEHVINDELFDADPTPQGGFTGPGSDSWSVSRAVPSNPGRQTAQVSHSPAQAEDDDAPVTPVTTTSFVHPNVASTEPLGMQSMQPINGRQTVALEEVFTGPVTPVTVTSFGPTAPFIGPGARAHDPFGGLQLSTPTTMTSTTQPMSLHVANGNVPQQHQAQPPLATNPSQPAVAAGAMQAMQYGSLSPAASADPSTWSPNPFFNPNAWSSAQVAGSGANPQFSNTTNATQPTNADSEQGTTVSNASTEETEGE